LSELLELLHQIITNFQAIQPADVIDILIVAFVIYGVLELVRKTRAAQLAKGVLLLLVVYALASWGNLRTVTWLLDNLLQIGFLALVVLFQPELRRALEQMSRTDKWAASLFRMQRMDDSVRAKWRSAAVAICDAAEQLSDTHTGALIVLERTSNLSEIIRTGTTLNADVNPEMLGTIFYEGTPLHDGAVIVRDGMLKAAGCVLPLSNNLEIGKDMGTRHRAALGMSENSDAVVVVVSEETGIISLAKNGVLIRRLDRQNLFNLLQGDIVPADEDDAGKPAKSFRLRRKKKREQDAQAKKQG